jgi:hypothetical protein
MNDLNAGLDIMRIYVRVRGYELGLGLGLGLDILRIQVRIRGQKVGVRC